MAIPFFEADHSLDIAASSSRLSVDRRASTRVAVVKSAKILFGTTLSQGVIDCRVLDESEQGLRVDLGCFIKLPEEFTVEVRGGRYLAKCAWSAGTEAGLALHGYKFSPSEFARQMSDIAEQMRTQGLGPAYKSLRNVGFFNDVELHRAADEAQAAMSKLEQLLLVYNTKPLPVRR